jgi:hypothetical protein
LAKHLLALTDINPSHKKPLFSPNSIITFPDASSLLVEDVKKPTV